MGRRAELRAQSKIRAQVVVSAQAGPAPGAAGAVLAGALFAMGAPDARERGSVIGARRQEDRLPPVAYLGDAREDAGGGGRGGPGRRGALTLLQSRSAND